jgi:hypothetical protein
VQWFVQEAQLSWHVTLHMCMCVTDAQHGPAINIHGRRHRRIPVGGTFPVRRVCFAVTTLAIRGRRRRHNDTIKFGRGAPASVDPVGQLAVILQALVFDCVLQASERSSKPRILPSALRGYAVAFARSAAQSKNGSMCTWRMAHITRGSSSPNQYAPPRADSSPDSSRLDSASISRATASAAH